MRRAVPLALISLVLMLALGAAVMDRRGARPSATAALEDSRRNAIVTAAERAGPAVVAVGTRETRFRAHLLGPFLLRDPEGINFSMPYLGSGVIVNGDEGWIVTNSHVVEGLTNFLVTLPDGRQLDAELLGIDARGDLALLRVEEADLPEIALGSSGDLMIGEWALAIGNPFGDLIGDPQPTVTAGVISALHRDFRGSASPRIYHDMIQTDASINPGNSGGALVNVRGELIGINTFIISSTGSSADIGFSIPVARVHRALGEYRQHGRFRQIYQDFLTWTLTRRLARLTGALSATGAIVIRIDTKGPAASAGLQLEDIITAVNGEPVTDMHALEDHLFSFGVGEVIRLTVQRGQREETVEYRLAEDRH